MSKRKKGKLLKKVGIMTYPQIDTKLIGSVMCYQTTNEDIYYVGK